MFYTNGIEIYFYDDTHKVFKATELNGGTLIIKEVVKKPIIKASATIEELQARYGVTAISSMKKEVNVKKEPINLVELAKQFEEPKKVERKTKTTKRGVE